MQREDTPPLSPGRPPSMSPTANSSACLSTTNPNRRLQSNNPTDQLDLHGQEAQTETWKAFMTACTKSDISFSCIKLGASTPPAAGTGQQEHFVNQHAARSCRRGNERACYRGGDREG